MTKYSNTKAFYSIGYPSSWHRDKTAAADLMARSADTFAWVSAEAIHGSATEAQLKAQQSKVLHSLGTAAGPLTYSKKLINKWTYAFSELVVKKNGKLLDAVMLDTVGHGYIYDFSGGVLMKTAATKLETQQIDNALNSIVIK